MKKVSEVANHSLGKMLDKAKNRGEMKPYLRNLNVRWFDFDLSDVLTMPFLPEETAKYTAVKGDVLICEGGYPGRAAIWQKDDPIYFQKALHRVRFHEPDRNKWFVYYLHAKDLDGTLKEHFNGAGIQHFTGEALAEFRLPFPPLNEQQRIVRILDKAFEAIATAKANTKKNLQNAREIFDCHAARIFGNEDDRWPIKRLDEVAQIIMGQSPDGHTYNSTGTGVPLINGPVEFTADPFGLTIKSKFTTSPTKLCKRGDLILCVRGSTTGRMNIAGFDACIGRGVAAIRAHEFQPWINHFVNANRQTVYHLGTGATFPNVSGPALGAMKLSFPNLSVQKEKSETLDSLRAETQRLESIYQRKLAALEELKKSLLHQAFSGQL